MMKWKYGLKSGLGVFLGLTNLIPNLIGAFMLMIFSAYASVDIYKTIDENGRVTYDLIPVEGSLKLNLGPDPGEPAPIPAKLTKKQRERIENAAKEVVKLRQESRQAQAVSVVECKGEKSCKKAFALTQVFISQHSDMKLQIVTDTVIEAYNHIEHGQLALKATKTPRNGDVEKINLIASCKEQYTDNLCLMREIDAYKQFRPYIEASLR